MIAQSAVIGVLLAAPSQVMLLMRTPPQGTKEVFYQVQVVCPVGWAVPDLEVLKLEDLVQG